MKLLDYEPDNVVAPEPDHSQEGHADDAPERDLMAPSLMLYGFALMAGGTPLAQTPRGASAEPIYSALAGAWVGSLEYRDYSSNARVALPTILDVRKSKDSPSLVLHYIYDDGPTKVVQDSETVIIDPAAATYVTVSADGKATDRDVLAGADAFLKARQGRLVRSGKGIENGKSVDVRTTLTVSPRSLTILKETRPLGGTFQFRDQYNLVRVGPVTTGK